MIIRDAADKDYPVIFELVREAFASHPHSNQTEHIIVQKLLRDNALPISLVAELDGVVRGYIAFSSVTISGGSANWFGLGPVAVTPQFQKRGLGKALIEEGIKRLEGMNASGCVVLGDALYYPRFGFENQPSLILEGVPQEHFMALVLKGLKVPSGNVGYHPAFFE